MIAASRRERFVAYLGQLRLGVYTHRENAGRRLLTVRRHMSGWRHVRTGLWKHRVTGLTLRIQREISK